MSEIHCPKCNSTQLTSGKKGFSGKKAVAGAVLTGGIGLLAGTIGSNKVKITCLACGHVFNPGEGIVKNDNAETAEKIINSDVSDFDNSIIAIIKSSGKLAAIKEVKEKTGVGLGEAKTYVDNLASQHNVTPGQPKSGCAGLIIFFIISGYIAYLLI